VTDKAIADFWFDPGMDAIGGEAGLLWDGALLVAGTPGFLGLSGRSG
jgi:hypothetical protein